MLLSPDDAAAIAQAFGDKRYGRLRDQRSGGWFIASAGSSSPVGGQLALNGSGLGGGPGLFFRSENGLCSAIDQARFVLCNFEGNGAGTSVSGEVPITNSLIVRAGLENVAGNISLATWGGERYGQLGCGGVLFSDPFGYKGTAGEKPFERIYLEGFTDASLYSSTNQFYGDATIRAKINIGDQVNAYDLTDQGTATAAASVGGYKSTMILGYRGGRRPTKPSVAIFGDSIDQGTGASCSRDGANGWAAMGVSGLTSVAFPGTSGWTPDQGFVQLAKGSESMAQFLTPSRSAKRFAMAMFADIALIGYGTNDIGGDGLSAAVTYANLVAFAQRLCEQGIKVIQCTVLPRPTSTDSYITAANQTAWVTDATRITLNNNIRNNFVNDVGYGSNYCAVFDRCAYVEVNSSNVLTLDAGRWKAPASTTPLYSGTVTSGGTSTRLRDTALGGSNANDNQYRGQAIKFTSGVASGKTSVIEWHYFNAGSHLMSFRNLGVTPATSDTYQIHGAVGFTDGIPCIDDGIHPLYAHQIMALALRASGLLTYPS